MIEIIVNDQSQQVPSGMTVAELLPRLGISSPAIAVEVNHQLCPRDQLQHRTLEQGDCLEIVTLVGGG